ncbi:hypothetical protein FRC07_007907 [Ceratobasidium sp. 392]|nr:hypothetical protein FRC07_007907 [Ceratobasidium sp. 392]
MFWHLHRRWHCRKPREKFRRFAGIPGAGFLPDSLTVEAPEGLGRSRKSKDGKGEKEWKKRKKGEEKVKEGKSRRSKGEKDRKLGESKDTAAAPGAQPTPGPLTVPSHIKGIKVLPLTGE